MDKSRLVDYYRSEIGSGVSSIICQELLEIMNPKSDEVIMGLGMATIFLNEMIALSPANFNPTQTLNLIDIKASGFDGFNVNDEYYSFFADPEVIPLTDCSVDKLFIIHGINNKALLNNVIRSSWRILKDNGQLVIVFVNKKSPLHILSSRMLPEDVAFSVSEVKSVFNDLLFQDIKSRKLAASLPSTIR